MISVCVCVCMCKCVCLFVHVCVCKCVRLCVYVCVCVPVFYRLSLTANEVSIKWRLKKKRGVKCPVENIYGG